jgi:hypothetical protein
MRATSACVVLTLALIGLVARTPQAGQLSPTDAYRAIVNEYRTGDPETAVSQLTAMRRDWVERAARELSRQETPAVLQAAAAVHTEVALRPEVESDMRALAFHLAIAGALVERRDTVTPRFHRLWYTVAIIHHEGWGNVIDAERLLDVARVLYPHDAEMLMLAAVDAETRASARFLPVSNGERRQYLARAEGLLREQVSLAPDEDEGRLRLGRVLQVRGSLPDARTYLTQVSASSDLRVRYLASLFLGGVEDAANNPSGAAEWYARAQTAKPSSQAAALAQSELQHRLGNLEAAAATARRGIAASRDSDPWWSYSLGPYWRLPALLAEMRKEGRE